jgi:cytochrome c
MGWNLSLHAVCTFRPAAIRCIAFALLVAPVAPSIAAPSTVAGMNEIGRAATPAEVKAWDIDVRGDFKGLPKGSGSVSAGADLWDAKCSSCHGAFGESNSVFTPIVGGTSKKDIETGRVYFLSHPGYTHRTTLMKASKLSSIWDYIHRAMPWNAPKSLSNDDVYALVAYILNLGEIVPADFTLSDQNIAQVQEKLPNRFGHEFYKDMWLVRGKGDVVNPLCMTNCPTEGTIESSLPDGARNSNGNIAEQVRPFGPARGTDTSVAARTDKVGIGEPVDGALSASTITTQPAASGAATKPAAPTAPGTPAGLALVQASGCTACHAVASKVLGPAFQDVSK